MGEGTRTMRILSAVRGEARETWTGVTRTKKKNVHEESTPAQNPSLSTVVDLLPRLALPGTHFSSSSIPPGTFESRDILP